MRNITFWLSVLIIFHIRWENISHLESLGTLTKGSGLLVEVSWVVMFVSTSKRPHAVLVIGNR